MPHLITDDDYTNLCDQVRVAMSSPSIAPKPKRRCVHFTDDDDHIPCGVSSLYRSTLATKDASAVTCRSCLKVMARSKRTEPAPHPSRGRDHRARVELTVRIEPIRERVSLMC